MTGGEEGIRPDIWQTSDKMSFAAYGLQNLPWVMRPATDVDFTHELTYPYQRMIDPGTAHDDISRGFRERFGLGQDPKTRLKFFKYGNYEEVYRVYHTDSDPMQTCILTAPKVFERAKQGNIDIFEQSTDALRDGFEQSTRLGINAFVGPSSVVWVDKRFPVALYPESLQYEEMNLTFDMRRDVKFPHFRFYGKNQQLLDVKMFDELPNKTLLRLNAYITGKILVARTLQVLMTLEEKAKNLVMGRYPRDSIVAAGDYMGRFDEKGKLHIKIVCFRGGTESIATSQDLLEKLLESQEVAVKSEADFTGMSLVPPFLNDPSGNARREWVSTIIQSTMREVYERAVQIKEDRYAVRLAQFASQSDIHIVDLPKQRPFTEAAMQLVAGNFGPEWIKFIDIAA